MSPAKAGYEYLLAYKLSVVIYDYTVVFCKRHISDHKMRAQMIGAARSFMSNIVEGNKHASLKSYIYLSGIARGSLEELLEDYRSFARQKDIRILSRDQAKREIREIGGVWRVLKSSPTLPSNPQFPYLPNPPYKSINLLLTLGNQAGYLTDKLIASLKEKHRTQGGLTENLYRARTDYRRKSRL